MARSIVNGALSGGLRILESLDPAPTYLGGPLPAAHRARNRASEPVVLVSGFANSPNSWRRYAASLARDGFRVFVIDLPGRGLTDMRDALDHVRGAIDVVRRTTGASRLDLVGFSEGGILARMYAENLPDPPARVDAIVTIATPHRGADGWIAALAGVARLLRPIDRLMPTSVHQLVRGMSLVGPRGAAGIHYTSVYSAITDGMVSASAAQLPGARNIALAPGLRNSHYGMLHWSDEAYDAVRSALTGS